MLLLVTAEAVLVWSVMAILPVDGCEDVSVWWMLVARDVGFVWLKAEVEDAVLWELFPVEEKVDVDAVLVGWDVSLVSWLSDRVAV